MRQEGSAKLDIQIKSDWLLICLTFVAKSPGCETTRTVVKILVFSYAAHDTNCPLLSQKRIFSSIHSESGDIFTLRQLITH